MRVEDARTTIQHRREARRQYDEHNSPVIDEPAPVVGGYLPSEVGCPDFTNAFQQVR